MAAEQSISELCEHLGGQGVVLSVETRAALSSSLLKCSSDEKLSTVKLWGRIVGTIRDYYVAQGFTKDPMGPKKFFYSMEPCSSWFKFKEDIEPAKVAAALRIRERFRGTLSYEYTDIVKEANLPKPPGSDETPAADSVAKLITTMVTEEERLSAVVNAIANECTMAPRGALRKTAAGVVELNPSFGGLSNADAVRPQYYLKVRPPVNVKNTLTRAQDDLNFDFLDRVSDDQPACWAKQYGRGGKTALFSSTLWPGFLMYHVPGTKTFDNVYFGTGLQNQDLAFMTPE